MSTKLNVPPTPAPPYFLTDELKDSIKTLWIEYIKQVQSALKMGYIGFYGFDVWLRMVVNKSVR